jgi:glycosyltransferase involved in cell wall biosynthesis
MRPAEFMRQHHAYQRLMLRLARGPERFDVVHNNSLHYLPVAMAELLPRPMVTTLHTPPTPWLEPTIGEANPEANRYIAVSEHTRRVWQHAAPGAHTIPNGIDLPRWPMGPGGDRAIWCGRIVPEKGPHLAMDAAGLAGLAIDLVGPIADHGYWVDQVQPRLGTRARWLGHLAHRDMAVALGRAAVALVTPCWDEPYGLVVAEALACGTPVAAFDRGALPELLTAACGALAPAGDVAALAQAAKSASRLRRRDARRRAEQVCCAERMVEQYLRFYAQVTS